MIILLTPTVLATDIVQLACFKMASILKVPMSIITPRWVSCETGGLSVEFEFDSLACELGITEAEVQAVIQSVWTLEYKPKLAWTLNDIKSVRL